MEVRLSRHAYLPDVTLGRLYVGSLILATLEEPWRANPFGPGGVPKAPGRQESCVPDGSYRLEPHTRTKDQSKVWALVNPTLGVYHWSLPPGQPYGRVAVLIHIGNDTEDTEGCILVGLRHGTLDGKPAVLESRTALSRLQAVLSVNEMHNLLIHPTQGTTQQGVL